MEIQKYLNKYKEHSPKEFFEWLSKGRTMEIRFLSDYRGNKFQNWQLIKTLAEKFALEQRYNSLYIKTFQELKNILLYRINGVCLTRLYNIFIGVNPKKKVHVKSKNGLMHQSYYGGIAGTSHIQTILADIEHIGERAENATEEMLEECIQGARFLVKTLELGDYYINISGNGVHLWFSLEQPIELPEIEFTEFADKIKYHLKKEPILSYIKNYNSFIEKLNKLLSEYNPNLKVDEGAKDIARIARPPGSWNVKKGKTQRAVGTVDFCNTFNKGINKKYLAAKPVINKVIKNTIKKLKNTKNHRYTHLNIHESPLYQLLVSRLLPSTYSRNHYLEQSFARLLRDNDIDITQISHLVSNIDIVQQKNVQIDPDYLDDESSFNPEMVNSYCINCGVDLVYPLLEQYPEVQDDFINAEHYESLNAYSDITREKMIINIDTNFKVESYLDLKKVIRKLVDQYEKTTVFFLLKTILLEKWDYYHRNKIVLQLLNKTRRKYI